MSFYRDWSGMGDSLIVSYCQEQLERISSGKKPSCTMETAESLFRLLSYLLNNKEELLERELSMIVLADSKAFEMKYRAKTCKLLCRYMNFEDKLEGIDNDREREKVILEEFGIYVNPSYVYLKGKVSIELKNGNHLKIGNAPLSLTQPSSSDEHYPGSNHLTVSSMLKDNNQAAERVSLSVCQISG